MTVRNGSAGRHGRGWRLVVAGVAVVAAGTVAACGPGSSGGSGGKSVKAVLILKTFSNPYFVSMENSAKAEAARRGVDLTVAAGTTDSDTSTQISAIDNAVVAGDAGIIIVSDGTAVNSALEKARAAGLYTIALDTVPIPPGTVNLTYATDNTEAGRLDGQWAAAKLAGKPADVALLDDLTNSVVSVDVDRDHGFLEGMGIPVGDPNINGREPASGHYTGGKGGTYAIACQLPTQGAIPGGKSAMQTCLQKDPNINVVYAINEPAAEGAAQALAAAGNKAIVVAIDGRGGGAVPGRRRARSIDRAPDRRGLAPARPDPHQRRGHLRPAARPGRRVRLPADLRPGPARRCRPGPQPPGTGRRRR